MVVLVVVVGIDWIQIVAGWVGVGWVDLLVVDRSQVEWDQVPHQRVRGIVVQMAPLVVVD